MRLSEYLIEAVARRKAGKYGDVFTKDMKYDDFIRKLDKFAYFLGEFTNTDIEMESSGCKEELAKKAVKEKRLVYLRTESDILIANRHGAMVDIEFDYKDTAYRMTFYEWSVRYLEGLESCAYDGIELGYEMLNTLVDE